ncbi:hypothetical protein BDV93DRAFT_607425 [Ceratobasidium sp. AG-I]|nr:hypothetical protein BDV93DRAFT_607425 [Ceratobasidium sp. AG-I]
MSKRLPSELILEIAKYLIWDTSSHPSTLFVPLKLKFSAEFAMISKGHREVYLREWFRSLTLKSVEDWNYAKEHGIANYARILFLTESALLSHKTVKGHFDLSDSQHIHTLFLDCHNDVGCSKSCGQTQWSYKRIMPRLPRGLKSLAILNGHGPDLQVIRHAITQCPDLEHLRLGRCTKYNRPDDCNFWQNFPKDHDSYFSNKGIDGYSKALGSELAKLIRLKSVFVNVYLTDTKYLNPDQPDPPAPAPTIPETSVIPMLALDNKQTHLHSDQPSFTLPPAPVSETPERNIPLTSSESQDRKDTYDSENSAATVIFECHTGLESVAFISYWSEDHLGWTIYQPKVKDQNCSYQSPHQLPDPGGNQPRVLVAIQAKGGGKV